MDPGGLVPLTGGFLFVVSKSVRKFLSWKFCGRSPGNVRPRARTNRILGLERPNLQSRIRVVSCRSLRPGWAHLRNALTHDCQVLEFGQTGEGTEYSTAGIGPHHQADQQLDSLRVLDETSVSPSS